VVLFIKGEHFFVSQRGIVQERKNTKVKSGERGFRQSEKHSSLASYKARKRILQGPAKSLRKSSLLRRLTHEREAHLRSSEPAQGGEGGGIDRRSEVHLKKEK